MKLIAATTLFLSLLLSAQAVEFEVECSAPDFKPLNRFSLEQIIVADEESKNVWKVENFQLTPILTKAGNEVQEVEAALEVSGTLTKIESSMTKNPYYNLKLMSGDKKIFANLNIDFPSNLSSQIRTAEGRLYKAKCKLVNLQ